MDTNLLYYAVYMENTLGALFSTNGRQYLCILHASILRGSAFNWLSGPVLVNMDNIRKATVKDFEDYRVYVPSDFTELQNQ